MRFSTFIFRNVLRRPMRSTLTVTGMAIAVTAVVALVGLSDGFNRTMLQQYTQHGVALMVTRKDQMSPQTAVMPEKVAHDIESLPGVTGVCPGLLSLNPIEEFGDDPMIIQGWQAGNYMFNEIKIISGENLSEKDRGKKVIIVGEEVARLKSVKVGDEVTISDEKYKIVGVFQSAADMENGMVIMLLDQAQKAFGKVGKAGEGPEITGCTVKLKDVSPENVQATANIIETKIAEANHLKNKLRARPPADFVKNNGQIQMFKGFAWAVSLITLIVGGIGVLNTMFMSVFERTREIGILRAIGWRPSRVMRMILLESLALSLGAGIIGTLIGMGVISLMGFMPVLSGAVHAAISADIVLKGFAIAVLVGIAGAAYPAYRGSRLLPTEALRHE